MGKINIKRLENSLDRLEAVATEFEEQCAVFRWAEMSLKRYPELELLTGSLNGIRISIGAAVKAKKAGLKKGFPDISLDVPRRLDPGLLNESERHIGFYHGLRIELKAMDGEIKPSQMRIMELLRANGYRAVVCFGANAAINEIESYLELPKWGKWS